MTGYGRLINGDKAIAKECVCLLRSVLSEWLDGAQSSREHPSLQLFV